MNPCELNKQSDGNKGPHNYQQTYRQTADEKSKAFCTMCGKVIELKVEDE